MLRFYKDFMERVLVCLAALKIDVERAGITENQVPGVVARNTPPDWPAVTREALANAVNEMNPGFSIAEMMDTIAGQLTQLADRGPTDRELVDTFVKVLQLPYGRGRLGPDFLQQLRQALLLPNEAAGLTERLREAELHCANCNHRFQPNEAATVTVSRGSVSLLCMNCRWPERVPCGRGKHSVVVRSADFGKIVEKAQAEACGACAIDSEDTQEGTDPGDITMPPPQAVDYVVGRTVRTNRTEPVRVPQPMFHADWVAENATITQGNWGNPMQFQVAPPAVEEPAPVEPDDEDFDLLDDEE